MKCPVCDAAAAAGATFCQQCGAKLPKFDARDMGPPVGTSTADDRGAPRENQSSAQEDSGRVTSSSGRRIIDVPEEILWEGTYSPKAMIGTAVAGGAATIALFIVAMAFAEGLLRTILLALIVVVWLVVAARLGARRLGISYKLTNHMLYHRRGLLTRVTDRIELIEVHDVTYEQGLFNRLVGVGRIKISSSDRTDPIFYLRGVQDVENVAALIDKARRGEQVRRGRRIDFSHIDGET